MGTVLEEGRLALETVGIILGFLLIPSLVICGILAYFFAFPFWEIVIRVVISYGLVFIFHLVFLGVFMLGSSDGGLFRKQLERFTGIATFGGGIAFVCATVTYSTFSHTEIVQISALVFMGIAICAYWTTLSYSV